MQGYVDPAHYRTEVGEWVLSELMGPGGEAPATPFVTRPSVTDLEQQLTVRRAALADYLAAQPDIAALAADLAARGKALRETRNLNCASTGN